MSLLVDRGDMVTSVIGYIKAGRSEFNLVKPYEGELDRYRKIDQIKAEIFPAEVNLQSPFALVISKDREKINRTGNAERVRHNLSIYVGVNNDHNFASQINPDIWNLLSLLTETLLRVKGLYLVNEGIYLCKTDLFTVYDQQWYRNETLKL